MSDPSTRPTTEVRAVLLSSMDRMVGQLVDRLHGLTVDEYLWEPVAGMWSVRLVDGVATVEGAGDREADPAPATTIAWRLWHIAVDCFDDYTRRFASDPADAPTTWTMDPDEAVAALQHNWARYRQEIDGRTWWDQLGDDWGPWSQHAVADMAMHASNELVHHAAEIGVLRDLYRSADSGGLRPPS